MHGFVRYRPYALLCALVLVLCVLASYPVAEIGINDDWSYIWSAKRMAETGHFVYVGWASAMLGWMVPLGAAFIKLFGFSFTAVRASNVLIAAMTAFVAQRCFVRAGLNEWNGTVVALTLVLSPVYLALTTSFMTDIAGLFATLVCLYGCLRALESEGDRATSGWLACASVASAIGGTARQTAWLGVLVMVPSTFWLVRHRRLNWVGCGLTWVGSVMFLAVSLRWFRHQPYALGEALMGGHIDRDLLYGFVEHLVRAGLALCLLLSPVLVAFVTRVRVSARRVRIWVGVAIAASLCLGFYLAHTHALTSWLAPFDGNYWTEKGLVDTTGIGNRGVMLGPAVRAVVSVFTLLCGIGAVGYLLSPGAVRERTEGERTTAHLSWRQLAVLIGPFTAAYLALLGHRALFEHLFDRYLLLLVAFAGLALARVFQERIAWRLSAVSVVLVCLLGSFAVAADHDLFAMERARVAAVDELTRAGVSRDHIYGGWEYDGWTQVQRFGWVNSGSMNTPQGYIALPPVQFKMKSKPCNYTWAKLFPAIRPQFALSFDMSSCNGPSDFPPEAIRTWLPPHNEEIYIRRVTTPVY